MVRWIVQSLVTTLTAMVFIYIIKYFSIKYDLPILKNLSQGI